MDRFNGLTAFFGNHAEELAHQKHGQTGRLKALFEAETGFTIGMNAFKNAITFYRRAHNVVQEHKPNKYYHPINQE